MRFERLPVDEALGAIAGHTVGHGRGTVKKGATFDETAIDALKAAGVSHVYAVRLDTGDVAENEAARQLAEAAGGEHTDLQALATGRANLKAAADGVALIDTGAVDAFNRIHEGITLATVPAFARVAAGQRIATVKIIPFAVSGDAMREALVICEGNSIVAVAPFRPRKVGLLLTRVSGTKQSVLKKSERVIGERIASLGSTLAAVRTVDHETEEIAGGIEELRAAGCGVLLVLGAAAIADRNDVVPAGLMQAGGGITHLGMPVEPGNLLMLGTLGGIPVIGAPSCARSPKENGFDWVLQRLLAGLDVTPGDIMGTGVGGLLQ